MTSIKNLPSWILSADKKYEKYIKKPEPVVEKVEEDVKSAPPKLSKSISKIHSKYEYSDDDEEEEQMQKPRKKVQPKKKAQPKKKNEVLSEEEDENYDDDDECESDEDDEETLKQKLKNLKNLKKYLKK